MAEGFDLVISCLVTSIHPNCPKADTYDCGIIKQQMSLTKFSAPYGKLVSRYPAKRMLLMDEP